MASKMCAGFTFVDFSEKERSIALLRTDIIALTSPVVFAILRVRSKRVGVGINEGDSEVNGESRGARIDIREGAA